MGENGSTATTIWTHLSDLPEVLLERVLVHALDRDNLRSICLLMREFRVSPETIMQVAFAAQERKVLRRQCIFGTLVKSCSGPEVDLNMWILELAETRMNDQNIEWLLVELGCGGFVPELCHLANRHPLVFKRALRNVMRGAYVNGQMAMLECLVCRCKRIRGKRFLSEIVSSEMEKLTCTGFRDRLHFFWENGSLQDDTCWYLMQRLDVRPDRCLYLQRFSCIFEEAWKSYDVTALTLLSDHTVVDHALTAKDMIEYQFLPSDGYYDRLKCLFGKSWKNELSELADPAYRLEQLLVKSYDRNYTHCARDLMMVDMSVKDITNYLEGLPFASWLMAYRSFVSCDRVHEKEWHELLLDLTAAYVRRTSDVYRTKKISYNLGNVDIGLVRESIETTRLSRDTWLCFLENTAHPAIASDVFEDGCLKNDSQICRHLLKSRSDAFLTQCEQSGEIGRKCSVFFDLWLLTSPELIFVCAVRNNDLEKIRKILKRVPWIHETFHRQLLDAADFLQHREIESELLSFSRTRAEEEIELIDIRQEIP